MTMLLGPGDTDTKHTQKESYSLTFCLRAVRISKSLRGIRARAVPMGPSWSRARNQLGKIKRLKAAVEEEGGTETERKTKMETGFQ